MRRMKMMGSYICELFGAGPIWTLLFDHIFSQNLTCGTKECSYQKKNIFAQESYAYVFSTSRQNPTKGHVGFSEILGQILPPPLLQLGLFFFRGLGGLGGRPPSPPNDFGPPQAKFFFKTVNAINKKSS